MGLHLPRTAWPIMCSFASSSAGTATDVEEASAAAIQRLTEGLRSYENRTAIRVAVVDNDEVLAAMGDLGIDAGSHRDVVAFCQAHPSGRLVIAYADYEPRQRGFAIL